MSVLSACGGNEPDRQNHYHVQQSIYSEMLPDAESISDQYIPPRKDQAPSSQYAYHMTPTVSYEDNTLDDNISSSIELSDYYAAVQQAGWVRWLQGAGPYTVLAVPNGAMESYGHNWPGGLMAPANQKRLADLMGDSILIGDYNLPRLRHLARLYDGNAEATTLTGRKVFLRPLPSGEVIVISAHGATARITNQPYPQSNGTLYVVSTVIVPDNSATEY